MNQKTMIRTGHLADQLSTKIPRQTRTVITTTTTTTATDGNRTTTTPTQAQTRPNSTPQKPKRTNLLLTLDAFETLFHPREEIHDDYASAAHSFGLSPFLITPERIKKAFKNVYKTQVKKRPNYGREYVLRGQYGGPRQWWDELIRASFSQAIACDRKDVNNGGNNNSNDSGNKSDGDGDGDEDLAEYERSYNEHANFAIPDGLSESLMHRFASSEGYVLFDDSMPFFKAMRQLRFNNNKTNPTTPNNHNTNTNNELNDKPILGIFDRVFLGVISNSDDRVPVALRSLGLSVGDVRADQGMSSLELPGFEERKPRRNSGKKDRNNNSNRNHNHDHDLDLIITSYEAGAEKPSRVIFDVAKRQARTLIEHEHEHEREHGHGYADVNETAPSDTRAEATPSEHEDWVYVHVGDDYEKDYKAAINAGWDSYLLPRRSGAGMDDFRDAKVLHSLMDLIPELERRYSGFNR